MPWYVCNSCLCGTLSCGASFTGLVQLAIAGWWGFLYNQENSPPPQSSGFDQGVFFRMHYGPPPLPIPMIPNTYETTEHTKLLVLAWVSFLLVPVNVILVILVCMEAEDKVKVILLPIAITYSIQMFIYTIMVVIWPYFEAFTFAGIYQERFVYMFGDYVKVYEAIYIFLIMVFVTYGIFMLVSYQHQLQENQARRQNRVENNPF